MDSEFDEDENDVSEIPSDQIMDAENEDDEGSRDVDDFSDLFVQGEPLGEDTDTVPLDFDSIQFGDTRLTNVQLRRTNKHTFGCSCSMILFSVIPLLALILDSVYLGHLVWASTAAKMGPLEHTFWILELSFIGLQNITGMVVIILALIVTITGRKIHFKFIFMSLLVLVVITTSSCIWSYSESTHATWFPVEIETAILPKYMQTLNWFTPMWYVQLKLVEVTTIFIMIWIWIWNWEQILELHADRENPTPEAVPSRVLPVAPQPEAHGPNCRGPYSLKVPRILTDSEPEPEPPSSSYHGSVGSRSFKPGTRFTGEEGDDETKAETEFREDGDRPGLAQPSRIIDI